MIPTANIDEYFMKEALKLATIAYDKQEIPVGCVVVYQQKIIAKGYNQTETLQDPTAHAEMIAITAATNAMGGKFLSDCTVYVTLEPCVMCAGALFWSRPERIVFGAFEEKSGFTRINHALLHPKTKLSSGVLDEDCRLLLTRFFQDKRS